MQTCGAEGTFGRCACADAAPDGGNGGLDDVEVRTPVAEVGAGLRHSCARYVDGRVACWGTNGEAGQLGNGATDVHLNPTPVTSMTDAAGLALMGAELLEEHSCAWRRDGSLWCWGHGYSGQLGVYSYRGFGEPHRVPGLTDIVGAVVVSRGTCAWSRSGAAWCWGSALVPGVNFHLGGQVYEPRAVTGLPPILQMAGTDGAMCARLGDGTVRCWGLADPGEGSIDRGSLNLLGDGVAAHKGCEIWDIPQNCAETPVTVAGVTDAVEVVAGGWWDLHFCVRRAGGTVACWGSNSYGELGDGTTTNRGAPVAVVGLTNVTQVAAGTDSTCAVRNDGTVWCWGLNSYGQLGDRLTHHGAACTEPAYQGLALDCSRRPVRVANIADAVAVQIGRTHACAVRRNGAVACWGENRDGQLGNGSTVDTIQPVSVVGL